MEEDCEECHVRAQWSHNSTDPFQFTGKTQVEHSPLERAGRTEGKLSVKLTRGNGKELSAGPTPAKLNNHPALMALTDSFIIPRSFITRHIRLMVLLSFLLSAFLAPGVKYQTMRVFYQPYRIQLHKGDGGGGNTSSVLYFSRQSYQGISNPFVMITWYPGCTERLCNETLLKF